MTRVLTFVDLDDTLFQTRRKCPADVADDQLTPLGFARDGSALSFATPRQISFLRWLSETTRLVPVTARSLDALRRVDLPVAAAICAHGGVILRDCGAADPVWAAYMTQAAAAHEAELQAIVERLAAAARRARQPIAARVLNEAGTPLYVLAKHEEADAAALAAIVAEAVPAPPPGWTVHLNGNNAAWLPPHLGKAKALAHLLPLLRAEHPDAVAIGVGDSFTDAPFMALCDFAATPTGSQLAAGLFDAR